MKIPSCRVLKLGETTDWGKRILNFLEEESVVVINYEPSFESFLQFARPNDPHILILENFPESKRWIQKLRDTQLNLYIIWLGKSFSKEDISFALEQRIYSVFENPSMKDANLIENFKKIASYVDTKNGFRRLIHSLKAVLLETEGELPGPLMNEIKSAINRLNQFATENEFALSVSSAKQNLQEDVLFQKSDELPDILSTIESLERTGILKIKDKLSGREGEISFLHGKITSASTGDVSGMKAIYRFFLWEKPGFQFHRWDPRDLKFTEVIDANIRFICSEGTRLQEHFHNIRKEIPPTNIKLELDPNYLKPTNSISADDFLTLSSVIEYHSVERILDFNPLPDTTIYDGLIRLKKLNLIRLEA